jgi:osmotically inducible lipoprotein OsmB
MKTSKTLNAIALAAVLLALAGCGTTTRDRVATGALIGGGVGAVAAGNPWAGAAIGGAAGAAIGGITSEKELNLGKPLWTWW